jgi:hypothetical protein
MEKKTGQVIVLRTLSAMLLVMAAGMILARLFFGLEISFTLVIGLITIAISNLVIAQKVSKDTAKPD